MHTTQMLTEALTDLSKQRDQIIMAQLSELVNRGLLVIEQKQPMIMDNITHTGDHKLTLSQEIKLVLKDQEYIEKLEAENKLLRERWVTVAKSLADISPEFKG